MLSLCLLGANDNRLSELSLKELSFLDKLHLGIYPIVVPLNEARQ